VTREDLAAKADWEGGLCEAIFGYGLKSSDLPKNAPSEIKQAFRALEAVKPQVDLLNKWLFEGY